MADDEILSLPLPDFAKLGVVESNDQLYLPVEVRRRTKTGGVEADEVLLCEPTNRQRFQARVDARAYCKARQLDADLDKDHFENIENVALLTYALRDKKTQGQLEPNVDSLLDRYHDSTLAELWGKLNKWCEMLDPRFGELSKERLWQVIEGMARGNLLPLVGMPTYAQSTCFSLMAVEACSSPNAPSWITSSGTSSAEPSTESSSSESSAPASSTSSSKASKRRRKKA